MSAIGLIFQEEVREAAAMALPWRCGYDGTNYLFQAGTSCICSGRIESYARCWTWLFQDRRTTGNELDFRIFAKTKI